MAAKKEKSQKAQGRAVKRGGSAGSSRNVKKTAVKSSAAKTTTRKAPGIRAATGPDDKPRCSWAGSDPLMVAYHDEEWGVPVHDDRKHFEFLVLESAQSGLSWMTVLRKRENYRKAFARFNPAKVAKFGEEDVLRLLQDPGIIRNRLKIEAAINNAKRFLEVQKDFGSFNSYCWQFVGGKPVVNRPRTANDLLATSAESDAFAKDLKARGFKFLGSTTIYAHMQAVGMVQDHMLSCFRR